MDVHFWMMSRDGFSFETWTVQTSIANRPVSAEKYWRHLPRSGWIAPLYNAGYEGCPKSVQLYHQCRSSGRCYVTGWEMVAAHSGTCGEWLGVSTARTRDTVESPCLRDRAQCPPLSFYLLLLCVGTLHPVFYMCNWETIFSVVLSCDATILG